MKLLKYITIPLLFFIFTTISYSKTAILPYKIVNPAQYLKKEMSIEYVKLVSIAAQIKKGIYIYPNSKLERDLKRHAFDPKGIITIDNLEMIGKVIDADYIMLGKLSRIKNVYRSVSLLYSIKDNRVISKCDVNSKSIYKLAEKEINAIFFNIPDVYLPDNSRLVDAALLVDLSYSIRNEWEDVKKGILNYAKAISKNWSKDIKISLIPISGEYKIKQNYLYKTSNLNLNKMMNTLEPRGRLSERDVQKGLKYAINNILWRKDSNKSILFISNSPIPEGSFLERFAIKAKHKGILVFTISLGRLDYEALENIRQLAVIGNGQHKAIAYRQRIYNEKGKPIDISMEGGRLFHSLSQGDKWKNGLLYGITENKTWNLHNPSSYLNEIFYNNKKYKITPYNMLRYYSELSGIKYINNEKLENNLIFQLGKIGTYTIMGKSKYTSDRAIGKVMLTDGKISFWIRINAQENFDFFIKRKSSKYFFPVGVNILKDTREPYEISFNSDYYITRFSNKQIPDNLKTSLKKIIKNSEYHMSQGLFRPPLWFINVRVERIESVNILYDIRERIGP